MTNQNEEHNHDPDRMTPEEFLDKVAESLAELIQEFDPDAQVMSSSGILQSRGDPHQHLTEEQVFEDHQRMTALHEKVTAMDSDFLALTDGDKLRQMAYRLLVYGAMSGETICIHDNPVAWSLLDIADRLDLADISEGVASP